MEWTSFLLNEPTRKYYGVCEATTGLYFPLPDAWQGVIALKYGENENNWQVVRNTDQSLIVDFMLLPTGYSEEIQENQIVVNAGALQVRVSFDESVLQEQRQYIATGVMYIK